MILSGCASTPAPEPLTPTPSDSHVSTFNVHPSASEIAKLDHAVVDEGHDPWRFDPDQVAEVEMMGHLAQEEQIPRGEPTHALYEIRRNGATAVVKIQWQRKVNAEVFLENTRTNGSGCWYVDHLIIIRPSPASTVPTTNRIP